MTHAEGATILWRDEYSIGVPDIDIQHQRLLFLLNKLNISVADGQVKRTRILLDLFDDLNDYAKFHFSLEETLMKEHLPLDEEATRHLAAHRAYWSDIPSMTERYKSGDVAAALELLAYLNRWWLTHILGTDKEMGRKLALCGVA